MRPSIVAIDLMRMVLRLAGKRTGISWLYKAVTSPTLYKAEAKRVGISARWDHGLEKLAALERLKNPHRLMMGKKVSPVSQFFSVVLDLILWILAIKENRMFEFLPDLTTDFRVNCP